MWAMIQGHKVVLNFKYLFIKSDWWSYWLVQAVIDRCSVLTSFSPEDSQLNMSLCHQMWQSEEVTDFMCPNRLWPMVHSKNERHVNLLEDIVQMLCCPSQCVSSSLDISGTFFQLHYKFSSVEKSLKIKWTNNQLCWKWFPFTAHEATVLCQQ